MKKKLTLLLVAMLVFVGHVKAQTDVQLFYDFGSDRKFVTLTLEMFKGDKWGSSYFFVDHDFNYQTSEATKIAPGGTYLEITRSLNFWQDTKLAPLSLHVEYNGGLTQYYPIKTAWLLGVDYFIHSKDYKNTLTLQALYKTIRKTTSDVPMQLTMVWGCQDLFGLKGLQFCGFADFWWQDNSMEENGELKESNTVFITEPQLWYNIGRLVGCDNLNVGTEIELSNDFGTPCGFKCRPCLGVKWNF